MAGKSSINDNFAPGPPATRFNASGKNREFYTFDNAPGAGDYATGGTIIDGGDGYIYHIFTGTGTFAVNRPSAAIDSVDYLIVAGGGGAAPTPAPGANAGGGGGGMQFGNINISNSPGSYAITVGGGGPSGPGQPADPRNGSPSSALGVTATGGGGGAGGGAGGISGAPGGSGGGGYAGGAGGVGNTPTTIPRQGYTGGGAPPPGANAGGGGGAGGNGTGAAAPLVPVGGAGGPGRIAPEFPSTIVGRTIPAPVLPAWQPLVGPGGYSAGGHGMNVPAPLQRTSPVNSGYGGQTGGISGGSGIVCIRYKKVAPYSRATGGTIEPSTHPEHPGVFRHIFTGPGTFTVTDPTLQYIDYLAVGGGGGSGSGGGGGAVGGGGGAGGFVSSIHTSTTTPTSIPEAYPWNPGYSVRVGEQYPVGPGTYPIGIGTGGNVATVGNNTTIGTPGANQIIAFGGGRGGFFGSSSGGSGGSGGGSYSTGLPIVPGGTASPSPLIQGNPGGNGGPSPVATGGGGGGAGAVGGNGGGAGAGAVGWYSVLSPSAYGTPGPLTPTTIYRYFAGGGGGSPAPRSGGSGGGGPTATSGTTNTGGGGGGGAGGTGGPGIVIIQYPE